MFAPCAGVTLRLCDLIMRLILEEIVGLRGLALWAQLRSGLEVLCPHHHLAHDSLGTDEFDVLEDDRSQGGHVLRLIAVATAAAATLTPRLVGRQHGDSNTPNTSSTLPT